MNVDLDEDQLKDLDAHLKRTKSIKIMLIPADELYLSMKKFTWELVRYTQEGIGLKITFENP